MRKKYLILSIAILLINLTSNFNVEALPPCPFLLNESFYFQNYINNTNIKSIYPYFEEWKFEGYSKEYSLCGGMRETTLLAWRYTIPSKFSKYGLQYRFDIPLAVKLDNTAYFALNETPEVLISAAETKPEVKEFLEKYSSGVDNSNFIQGNIRAGTARDTNEHFWIMEYKNLGQEFYSFLEINSRGIASAILDLNEKWKNIPYIKISHNILKRSLDNKPCIYDSYVIYYEHYAKQYYLTHLDKELITTVFQVKCTNNYNPEYKIQINTSNNHYYILEANNLIEDGIVNFEQINYSDNSTKMLDNVKVRGEINQKQKVKKSYNNILTFSFIVLILIISLFLIMRLLKYKNQKIK